MRGRKPDYRTLQPKAGEERPKAPVEIPTCPTAIRGEARREWRRMAALLFDLGLIAKLDRSTLAVHCAAWAQWVDAQAKIAEQGPIVKSPNGYPVPNPYISIANQAAKQMQSLLSEFGLSPVARHRLLGVPKKSEPPKATGWEGTLANVVG
jgi:P27 family predicted phage terminase small subunit